jgi:hypothetical protein
MHCDRDFASSPIPISALQIDLETGLGEPNVQASLNSMTKDNEPSPATAEARLQQLQDRQNRLAELLNCPPEKIEHEVRNILNELRLLRTLFQSQKKT